MYGGLQPSHQNVDPWVRFDLKDMALFLSTFFAHFFVFLPFCRAIQLIYKQQPYHPQTVVAK